MPVPLSIQDFNAPNERQVQKLDAFIRRVKHSRSPARNIGQQLRVSNIGMAAIGEIKPEWHERPQEMNFGKLSRGHRLK